MQVVPLTVRILTALGRIHIVVFHDPQPAISLQNSLPHDIEVKIHSNDVTYSIVIMKAVSVSDGASCAISP